MPKLLRLVVTAILLTFISSFALSQDKSDTVPTPSKAPDQQDKKFMKTAAVSGLAEIQMGQLAQNKAKADEVKQFGVKMVEDHSKAADNLKNIAATQGVGLPEQLTPRFKSEKDSLSKLSGAQFDKQYIMHMVQNHEKAVSLFQKEANSGHDPAVKKYASETLPTLQDHLRRAKELKSKIQSSATK